MGHEAPARWLAIASLAVAVLALRAAWHEPAAPLAPVTWEAIAPPPGAEARDWHWIIVHHSAARSGDAAGIDRDHEQGRKWEGIAYHFVIGNGHGMPLGRIEATFRWLRQRQGAHAHSEQHNEHGIGICLIGDFERDQPDPRQVDRLVDLCAILIANVPGLSVDHILGHRDVWASTRCPGANLDLDRLRARVAERLAQPRTAP